MSPNRAASIRARLKRHADATGQDFNSILTRYGLERLVYRLSVSGQAANKSNSTGQYSLDYFLAILCSGIGAFYLRTKYSIHDRLFPWYTKKQLANFPMRAIDFSSADERKKHDQIVTLAARISDSLRQLADAKNPDTRKHHRSIVDSTDKLLDRAVFDLYDVSKDESSLI